MPYCFGYGPQLGMSCWEDQDNNTSCDRKMLFGTHPKIKPTDEIIDDGRLRVEWINCGHTCVETFTIRIERLGKSP